MAIEIDGGQGEGGGQIVRTAVALAGALGKDIRIHNIRKGRKPAGLRPQHIAAVSLAAEICDATVSGLKAGSTEIEFSPGTITGGEFEKDVGTAGSVSLVLQTCLIPALFAKAPIKLKIKGGTDVPWSPPIDYLDCVFLPLIRKLGAAVELEIEQRGFYPSGGGVVVADISPVGELKPVDLSERGELREIYGRVNCRNLPEHVADRMRNSARKALSAYPSVRIETDSSGGPSTGASIVLVGDFERTYLGASMLGEKGLPAEKVGESAAEFLRESIASGETLDEHASDQIIPFLFLAKGRSVFKTAELTMHAKTNISIVRQLIDRRISLVHEDRLVRVSVE
ncbi:MAG: RNA 3'-terminal phosphate cyclase [Thermoplasmata archaeon]